MSEAFQPGFGVRLREGREAAGLSVSQVATKLKLTSRQVEALEEEDLSHLPSPVFVRGFVRNYGRLVGVGPDDLIAPVDLQASAAETITAPSAGVNFSSGGFRRWVLLPSAAMAVFLILVAILYHWLRQGEDSLVSQEAPPPAAAPAPQAAAPTATDTQTVSLPAQAQVMPDGAANVPTPASAATPAAVVPVAPAKPAAAPLPPTTTAPAPATAGKPATSSAAPPVATTLPAALPPPQAATAPVADKPAAPRAHGPHTLRFEPAQDAWIQVVDGKGSRFSKLVHAGGSESFSGEPPFKLVVGEAAKVRMTYDGHHIDLTPFIGQKVARLTLE